jgi:hypothetical protein
MVRLENNEFVTVRNIKSERLNKINVCVGGYCSYINK